MPWCPQCKNEYRKGIRICADCGCELVEEEQFDDQVPVIFGEEEQMNSLKKYLEFNQLKGVMVRFSEEDQVYELLVREEDKSKATSMANVFLQQEAARKNQEETDCEEEGDEEDLWEDVADYEEETEGEAPVVYLNNNERAQENRSSAWMLLLVGTAGLVVMILGMFDVLPLHIGNPYMFYGVMSAVFLLFIVMGVISMKNAKIFAKKAESENTLRDTITKWYQENLDASAIDAEIAETDETSDEVRYFKRVEKIKEKLNHQFMNLDQAFLEHFIDEEVYDNVFSGEKE